MRRPNRRQRFGAWISRRDARRWYALFLLLLLLVYWVFVHFMERITFTPETSPFPFALPQFALTIAEYFMPRVLRHFLPVLAGGLLAYFAAVNLVWRLYDLPGHAGARDFLRRLRTPGNFLDDPLVVSARTLEEERDKKVRLRVGGPGLVKIPVGQVAVTEVNGRFFRILETGTRALDRFEYIHALLDLRRQEREDDGVTLRTREGLELQAAVGVTYRVATGDEPVTPRRPFPYDDEAVRRLAYARTNLGTPKPGDWEVKALSKVKAELQGFVARLKLEEIIQLDDAGGTEAQETIRTYVERKARAALRREGIDLLRVRISRLQLPEAVAEQYMQHWRAQRRTRDQMALVEAQAYAIEELEIARAEAELSMIQAIVEGVRRAQREGRAGAASGILALRLIEALEMLARSAEGDAQQPLSETLIPRLESLQSDLLDQRLLPGKSSDNPDAAAPPAERA